MVDRHLTFLTKEIVKFSAICEYKIVSETPQDPKSDYSPT